MISFVVPGTPQGKGRARAARVGNGIRMFTPAKTVNYEALIAYAGSEAMRGRQLIEGPVYLTVTATFDIPKSWSKKKRLEAQSGFLWHTGKPDGDNVLKALGDGLNGIVWKDDSQVAFAKILKRYGDTPGLHVVVEPLS